MRIQHRGPTRPETMEDKSDCRKFMVVVAIVIALAMFAAHAATFDIGWNDPNPATNGVMGYFVWIGSSNSGVRLGAVGPTNRVTITLPDGAYRLSVSATNLIEETIHESAKSLPLYVVVTGTNVLAITSGIPNAPLNLQLR